MSAEPNIVIRLDGDSRVHRPGESLAGEYWLESPGVEQVSAVEVSVLWYTEGKGDEDMAVHEFCRRDADEGHPIDPHRRERFNTTLPNSPLSYEGEIIKVRWCVRVRMFPHRGKEIVGERAFQLVMEP